MGKYFLLIFLFYFIYGQDFESNNFEDSEIRGNSENLEKVEESNNKDNSIKEKIDKIDKSSNSKRVKISKNKIKNFQIDYLINRVNNDIRKKVDKKIIDGRIAIVEMSYSDNIPLDSYSLSYLMVSMESLKFSNDEVSFVRSIDALSLRGYEIDNKLIIKRGVVSDNEMKDFVSALGAKYYARISVLLEEGYVLLVLSIYDVKDHTLIYKSSYANYYKDWDLTVSYSSYFGNNLFNPGVDIFYQKKYIECSRSRIGNRYLFFISSI